MGKNLSFAVLPNFGPFWAEVWFAKLGLTWQSAHACLQDMMAASRAGAGTRDALQKSNPLAIKVALLTLSCLVLRLM
jgi:hypothetical protein